MSVQQGPQPAHPADAALSVPGRAHFPCFDGLRAVAAVAVLLHHAGFATGYSANGRFGALLAHGDAGVPIFFLISGFLLYRPFVAAHLADRPGLPIWRFWWRRLLRIVPAFWAALLLVYLLFGYAQGALAGPRDVLTYFGFLQIYDPRRFFGAISQGWSLGTEMSFYLFLPLYALAVRAVASRVRVSRLRVEAIGLVGLYLTSVAFRVAVFSGTAYRLDAVGEARGAPWGALAVNYWLPSFLDLFAMGMALALLSSWGHERGAVPRALAWVGRHPALWWAMAGLSYWAVSTRVGLPRDLTPLDPHEALIRQLLYGLTALFLVLPAVFGPQDRGAVRGFLRSGPVAFVGLVSYGVYLWHQAWIGQVKDWLGWDLFQGNVLVVIVGALAFAVATAAASYYVVERPFLRLKDRPPVLARRAPATS